MYIVEKIEIVRKMQIVGKNVDNIKKITVEIIDRGKKSRDTGK